MPQRTRRAATPAWSTWSAHDDFGVDRVEGVGTEVLLGVSVDEFPGSSGVQARLRIAVTPLSISEAVCTDVRTRLRCCALVTPGEALILCGLARHVGSAAELVE